MSAIDEDIRLARLAYEIHPWVEENSRTAGDALVVCAALSWEIAETIARFTKGDRGFDAETMLRTVMDTMRNQIAARHRGEVRWKPH